MVRYTIIALVISLNLGFYLLTAQTNENEKIRNNEFDIVVDDIFAKAPVIYYPFYYWENQMIIPYYGNSYYDIVTTKIGLGYKHYFNNSGIRSKLSFGSNSDRSEYSGNDNSDEYNYLSANFHLGYEWLLKFGKAHIFYGVEGFVNQEKLNSESVYYNGIYRQTSKSNSVKTGYGASPLLGVEYFIAGPLSVSTEFKFIVEFYDGKTTYENSESTEVSETKSSGMKTRFGPLGQLSVNIHF
ncbi:MAG: hypothetical protein R2764_11130 [Bacteroidales bacterium]